MKNLLSRTTGIWKSKGNVLNNRPAKIGRFLRDDCFLLLRGPDTIYEPRDPQALQAWRCSNGLLYLRGSR